MSYTYEYPRPAVCTDIILINPNNEILLIKRLNDPHKNTWALPGGFVDKDEALIDAANRELIEETSISNIALKQFKTYGDPGRDPRGHTVSIVFYAHLNTIPQAIAGDDAKELQWFELDKLPQLAFDHALIINDFKTKTTKK